MMTAAAQISDTIGASIYHQLREDIVFGRLEPGRKLRLEPLRARYDVSVATLREVLPRLVAEDLIHFEAQKGFEVAPVSARDLAEISQMRMLLECHAIEASFANGDLEWEAQVVAAHHKLSRMEQKMLAGDRSISEAWKRYDREFHRSLIAACGSPSLLMAYDRIFDRFLRYQILLVMFRGGVATQEHNQLLDCVLRRDSAQAQAILARHIRACIDYTLTHRLLPEDPPEPQPLVRALPESLPVGEVIYRRLRDDIIMARLLPGQKLRLDTLREGYQAGLSTLREALSRLVADGFVVTEGQRGFEVAPISRQGLHDIANLRLLFETHALDLSFQAGGVDWEAAVIAAHHLLDSHEERLESGDTRQVAAWRESDWRFHQTLIAACGSRVLRHAHAEVFDQYLRYQMVALAFRPSASRPEHRALMTAALARDTDQAVALLRHHITAGVEEALLHGRLE